LLQVEAQGKGRRPNGDEQGAQHRRGGHRIRAAHFQWPQQNVCCTLLCSPNAFSRFAPSIPPILEIWAALKLGCRYRDHVQNEMPLGREDNHCSSGRRRRYSTATALSARTPGLPVAVCIARSGFLDIFCPASPRQRLRILFGSARREAVRCSR